MALFKRLHLNISPKKKPAQVTDETSIRAILNQQLEPYMKQEDVQKYLRKIEADKEKKRVWDSLSTRKKIKLLRYVSGKKEGIGGK